MQETRGHEMSDLKPITARTEKNNRKNEPVSPRKEKNGKRIALRLENGHWK